MNSEATCFIQHGISLASSALDAGDPEKAVKLLVATECVSNSDLQRKNINRAIEETTVGSVEKATTILDILAL